MPLTHCLVPVGWAFHLGRSFLGERHVLALPEPVMAVAVAVVVYPYPRQLCNASQILLSNMSQFRKMTGHDRGCYYHLKELLSSDVYIYTFRVHDTDLRPCWTLGRCRGSRADVRLPAWRLPIPPSSSNRADARQRRAALCAELASIGEFRPGSLQSRYRRCGKPSCHCA